MIEVPDDVTAVLAAGSYRYAVRVESWLDGELLSEDVPIVTGSEESDASIAVPERVQLTVPRHTDGFDWTPHDLPDPAHPLAANGQRLRVMLGVGVGNGVTEWFQRGEFLIYESSADGDLVSVTAVGLLYLISEARLVSPYQPTGTLVSTLRGLIEPALTLTIDGALVDRSVPSGVNYDEDRLGAVGELLDAWPARARVASDGFVLVEPVTLPTSPDVVLTSLGDTATVITVTGASTRDGAASVVVARGTAADGGQLQGVAYDLTTGPHAYGGPFNALPVPQYFYSPLLTTVAQCTAAARTILARLQRRTQNTRTITCVPRPDLELGDAIEDDGTLCTVEGLSLPYTAAGGAMTVIAREV